MTAAQELFALLKGATPRAAKHLSNLALDAAAFALATLCDNYPKLEDRRQICQLRLKLANAYFRIADLEAVVASYRAMHEMTHGKTIPSLTLTPPHDKNRDDIN